MSKQFGRPYNPIPAVDAAHPVVNMNDGLIPVEPEGIPLPVQAENAHLTLKRDNADHQRPAYGVGPQ